jgi:exopolysaccharide biosynthesis protein
MVARRVFQLCTIFCLLIGSLAACNNISISVGSSQATTRVEGVTQQVQLDVWSQVKPGVETRYEQWKSPAGDQDTVIITRFDLHKVHVSVGYQPDQPLSLANWMKQTKATAIINGGYFLDDNEAAALVVSNGQTYGQSYTDGGGMLSVNSQGTVALNYLLDHPYDPSQGIMQATQSRPMLIINGKQANFEENAASSRRTVVAMDKQGRLLFIVSPSNSFTIGEMGDLLMSHTELGIQNALNLDGGTSTGIYLNSSEQQIALDSINPLPIVIIVK